MTPSKITILFLFSFILGNFLADFFRLNWTVVVIQTILLMCLAVIFRKEKLVLVLSISSLIILVSAAYRLFYQQKLQPQNLPFNQEVSFQGIVIDEPDIRVDKIKLTIETADFGSKTKILVNLPRFPEYQYGDKLNVSGQLQIPKSFEDFDYRKYLERYAIFGIIYQPKVEKIGQGGGDFIHRSLFALKNKFEKTISQILPEPYASLLDGLILGVKRGIPQNLISAFNNTSTSHIVVISGYNITILIKIFYEWLKGWSRRGSFWLTVLVILLFSILTGASASVVRAALMGSVFLLAKQVGRQEYPILAVLFTAVLMLFQNPQILIFDRGFQLSFAAVLGLIYLSPLFETWFSKWKKWEKVPKILRETLTATLGAQIFTLPLLIIYFEKLSLVSLPANLLILTAVPTTMFLGFLAAILGMIWLPMGKIAGLVVFIFLKWIILWAETLSKIPHAFLKIDKLNFLVILTYYLILGFLLLTFWQSKFREKILRWKKSSTKL